MKLRENMVQQVWDKGRATPDRDPTEWRKDECGAWMHRPEYGNERSEFGWKIENVTPGGADEIDNLRPFHHDNGFDRPAGKARCHVTADREGIQPTAHIGQPSNREI